MYCPGVVQIWNMDNEIICAVAVNLCDQTCFSISYYPKMFLFIGNNTCRIFKLPLCDLRFTVGAQETYQHRLQTISAVFDMNAR